ncbi:MAG: hypothetical protein F6K56_21815 [Moorea sp. SIO3G5]|nr:hypothetical protein [Moorena sp. SIO3G5]
MDSISTAIFFCFGTDIKRESGIGNRESGIGEKSCVPYSYEKRFISNLWS